MKNWISLILILGLLILSATACMSLGDENITSAPAEPAPEEEEPSEPADTGDLPEPTMQIMPTATMAAVEPGATQPTPPAATEEIETVRIDLNTVYAEVVSGLPEGSALFNPAENMRLGEVYPVEVRVVPVTSEEIEEDEEVIATLTVGMEEEQPVVVIPLKVSTVMSAQLTGEAFTIKPLSREEQIRTPEQPYVSWIWEVRPEKTGEQRLTLHLSVIVNAEEMGDKTYTTSEVRVVDVGNDLIYTVGRFLGSNWEWVLTGLILPFLGWGYRKVRGRVGGVAGG